MNRLLPYLLTLLVVNLVIANQVQEADPEISFNPALNRPELKSMSLLSLSKTNHLYRFRYQQQPADQPGYKLGIIAIHTNAPPNLYPPLTGMHESIVNKRTNPVFRAILDVSPLHHVAVEDRMGFFFTSTAPVLELPANEPAKKNLWSTTLWCETTNDPYRVQFILTHPSAERGASFNEPVSDLVVELFQSFSTNQAHR